MKTITSKLDMTSQVSQSTFQLKELLRIFKILNESNIRYCHWKSNANLGKSFKSATDFDLLVSADDADRFHLCISKLGLKRRNSSADKVYPGMEDYLGFDATSGKIFHLHVHFKLVMGKKHKKNYRIPMENLILSTSRYDDIYPVKIIQPELELILLIIRSILKADVRPKGIMKYVRNGSFFPLNIQNEYSFLRQKINLNAFNNCVIQLFPDLSHLFNFMVQNNINDISYFQITTLRRRIRKALIPNQLFSPRDLRKETKMRQLASKNSRSWMGRGGITIAFVGADGSGKSSTVSHIKKWLSWKLSVNVLYMGLPKKNYLYITLDNLVKVFGKLNISVLRDIFNSFKWVYVAKKRLKIYRHAERQKNQGYIVVYDRFPLQEFWHMDKPMDGPRLSETTEWGKRERELYRNLKYPDFIILLRVTTEESARRKNEHGRSSFIQSVSKKIDAVDKLADSSDQQFIVIDTLRGREKSLLEIKKIIWNLL